MGTKDSKHNNSEGDALFRSAVDDARPIKKRDRIQNTAPVPRPKRTPRQAEQAQIADPGFEYLASTAITPGDKLFFQRGSVNQKVMRDLRRGRYPVREEVDLHGMTATEALNVLRDFISYSYQNEFNCISVVHGKGLGSGSRGPVLKAGVDQWLRQWDEVQAFCSALDRDGGTGAVYVLLKSR
jgi:DNA-nicking Smr family endonuclease